MKKPDFLSLAALAAALALPLAAQASSNYSLTFVKSADYWDVISHYADHTSNSHGDTIRYTYDTGSVLTQNGVATVLAMPGKLTTQGYAISENAIVVGEYIARSDNGQSFPRGVFTYANGQYTDLGGEAGLRFSPRDVNSHGSVVVSAGSTDYFPGMVSFGGEKLRTICECSLQGINESDVVVGSLYDHGDHSYGFVYQDGKITDLNTLTAPNSLWSVDHSVDINDAGVITAYGCQKDGGNCGILSLTPTAAVPEPGTYAMLLAGLGLLGWTARRRAAPTM